MAGSAKQASRSKLPKSSSTLNAHKVPRSAALGVVGSRPRRAQRRPTKQASYELANHAKAYLEGDKVSSGYDFLYSLLAAGTSISTPAQPYIGFLAPPAYIAFASSLIVDPRHTTKAQSSEARKGSDAALRYLQCVHTTIDGPAYPTIRKAFTFPEERTRRRAPGHRSAANSLSPEPGGDIERIMGRAANEDSLWYRAEDFWHIVGWAFNCSVVHKKRWNRWKLWLGTMLDFLDADWDICAKQSKNAVDQEGTLQDSLVWHYVVGGAESTNRGMRRRIVKAILATATPETLKEYPEIWENETIGLKRRKQNDQPLGEVDFETGEVGDYDSDEEMHDASEESDVVESGDDSSDDGIRSVLDASKQLGGQEAIELRQRFIALLALVAQALPAHFTTLSDLFDNILEDIIQLPTILFHVLISTLRLPDPIKIAFQANLLLPLVSGSVPDYFRFEPAQDYFESKLLLLKATTQSFAANAKISLILEQLLICLMSQNAITPTAKLYKAMETGIKARQGVLGTGKGKRGNAEEENQAKKLMGTSSNRLRGLLEVLEMSQGQPAQPMQSKGHIGLLLSFGSGSSLSTAPGSEGGEDN